MTQWPETTAPKFLASAAASAARGPRQSTRRDPDSPTVRDCHLERLSGAVAELPTLGPSLEAAELSAALLMAG